MAFCYNGDRFRFLSMKVVVLAAGRSKRLKPIEDKNFLQFLGKPLIQHQLEQLMKVGLKDFVVVGGVHNLAKLRQLAKTMRAKIQVVEQKNLDEGMAGGVLAAEKLVKQEPMLIVSANDVVENSAYELMLKAIKSESADKKHGDFSLLVGKKIDSYFPGGYLKVANNGTMMGIVEKPKPGTEPSKLINLVIHYHHNSESLFKALHKAKSTKDDRYEVALDSLIQAGVHMKAVRYEGFWQAIKYPWHVLDVMNHFLKGRIGGAKAQVAKSATLRGSKNGGAGEIYLEDGVKIMDNAVIIGPAYIGENTVIATNALVRGSHIGANCVIGFGTEVARSYLGDHVWTHTNYVGDSIIGNDVSFGSGTVTGNLRLDEGNISVTIGDEKVDSGRNKLGLITGDHVRAGINSSFMPGVKIGSNSVVGPGIAVSQDVPDNKYVYGKTELIMKDNKVQIDAKKRAAMKKTL